MNDFAANFSKTLSITRMQELYFLFINFLLVLPS